MDIYPIINSFTPEESAAFKTYLRSKNKRKDAKNVTLYDLVRKGTDSKDIDTLLYGKPNRNAYHALSKRLQDTLIDFIATRSFETETSDDMQVFKYILTSRIFYEQSQIKPAKNLLTKATQRAQELELYAALTECYHTQIQYSHLHPETNLDTLTQKAQENLRRYLQQEKLNMAYAQIKRTLIFDEHLLKNGIQKTVEGILSQFHIKIDETFTFKSLYQLLEVLNSAAHLDHNFRDALPFISGTYKYIRQKGAIKDRQRFYHIQVLYFMANAHFRVRDFEQATTYLTLMEHELKADKGRWESRFRENYILIHSFILNYTGSNRLAVTAIKSHKRSLKNQKISPDTTLALIVFLTQQQSYKEALTTLNTLNHTDRWYEEHLGTDWIIKKQLLTLIIYYELEYIDLTQSLLRSFKRKYKYIIETENRLEAFLKVFTKIANDPNCVDDKRFRESVKKQFSTSSLKDEDLFMLSFFAWIKSKLNKTSLYETTLALL